MLIQTQHSPVSQSELNNKRLAANQDKAVAKKGGGAIGAIAPSSAKS